MTVANPANAAFGDLYKLDTLRYLSLEITQQWEGAVDLLYWVPCSVCSLHLRVYIFDASECEEFLEAVPWNRIAQLTHLQLSFSCQGMYSCDMLPFLTGMYQLSELLCFGANALHIKVQHLEYLMELTSSESSDLGRQWPRP